MLGTISGSKSVPTKYFLQILSIGYEASATAANMINISVMLVVAAVIYSSPKLYKSDLFYNPFTNEKMEVSLY